MADTFSLPTCTAPGDTRAKLGGEQARPEARAALSAHAPFIDTPRTASSGMKESTQVWARSRAHPFCCFSRPPRQVLSILFLCLLLSAFGMRFIR